MGKSLRKSATLAQVRENQGIFLRIIFFKIYKFVTLDVTPVHSFFLSASYHLLTIHFPCMTVILTFTIFLL